MSGPILVVDDHADLRLLLRRLLDGAGFEVVEAPSGIAALELFARLGPGPGPGWPAAALLDVQMPDMDGWDTLAAIRANPATSGLPVVMCTVKGRPLDRERGWELGCDGYVTKPFDVDEVVAAIEAALGRSEEERVAARAAGLAEARIMMSAAER